MNGNKAIQFSIDFVVELDLINSKGFKKYKAPRGYNIDCPFCDGKKKMNVSVEKNVCRCAKCDRAFNPVTLHAELTHISNSEAYKDLKAHWNGLDVDTKTVYVNKQEKVEEHLEPANADILDSVYRKLLAMLTLSDRHKKDLLSRGLTEQQIEDNLYRTVPQVGFSTIAKKVWDSLNPYEQIEFFQNDYDALSKETMYEFVGVEWYNKKHKNSKKGVAGFYGLGTTEPMLTRCGSGYFVPVKNCDGKIVGLQIRHDALSDNATDEQKERYHKYSWFSSSGEKTGCSVTGIENIHFAGDFSLENIAKTGTVTLTEGALKADVAAALTGRPFLGLIGVNNQGQLEDLIFGLPKCVEKIAICLDADVKTNPAVQKAQEKIVETMRKVTDYRHIHSREIQWQIVTWEIKDGKGIDDFLLNLTKKKY